MLEFKDVIIKQGQTSPDQPISFIVGHGDLCCVGGPANSGKSQLIRAVLGFNPVQSGYITLDQELVTRLSAPSFRKRFFYIPSDVSISSDFSPKPFDQLSLSDLLLSVSRLQVNSKTELDIERLKADLTRLGLDASVLDRHCYELSQNQLHRAMLALAPQLGKELLLADELTSGMDENEERLVINFLGQLLSQGMGILLTCYDHDMLLSFRTNEHFFIRNLSGPDSSAPASVSDSEPEVALDE